MPQIHSKPWIVQKYGGTSIGKLLPTITDSIIPAYLKSNRVAVVCSARSSTLKSQGTTSLLLEAVQLATSPKGEPSRVDEVIDLILDDHLVAAKEAIGTGKDEVLEGVKEDIRKDCDILRRLLKATSTLGEISERTTDRVLAVGETLSCRIVAASLQSKVSLSYHFEEVGADSIRASPPL